MNARKVNTTLLNRTSVFQSQGSPSVVEGVSVRVANASVTTMTSARCGGSTVNVTISPVSATRVKCAQVTVNVAAETVSVTRVGVEITATALLSSTAVWQPMASCAVGVASAAVDSVSAPSQVHMGPPVKNAPLALMLVPSKRTALNANISREDPC